jgi:hypothetical protein
MHIFIIQLNQARLYVHIMDVNKQRFEQEYFRIGCYGMGFHDFLQVPGIFVFKYTQYFLIESCFCIPIGSRTKIR